MLQLKIIIVYKITKKITIKNKIMQSYMYI